MWASANTGWWPLIWFTAKVWGFLFIYFWLRATLPRLPYDQFMALGWKLLIPVSLVWVMVAAIIRSLRNQGYQYWTPTLVFSSIVVAAAMVLLLRKPLSAPGARASARQRGDEGTSPEPAFPTPPLLAGATKENAGG